MYHSKNSGSTITLPHNYGGNAFNISEEKDDFSELDLQDKKEDHEELLSPQKVSESTATNSLLAGISTEDLLLLGLILVIKDTNPNDPVFILLLILLLTK